MGTIYIATTHRSASSLGIMAEASNVGTAIRNVARQLIEQGRLPSLPVVITDHSTGFTLAQIVSSAVATHPETYTKAVTARLPRKPASILHGEARAA